MKEPVQMPLQASACEIEKITLPQIVSIKQASEIMNLPPYYLRRVCRENPDLAFQSGVKWYINLGKWESYRESLQKLRGKNFIVINDFGWPISPDHYGKIVDRVAEKAGIRKIHPHMFRHTFVSILLSNPDIGVATVAAEAGHAQPSTTLAIYTQVYHKRQDSIRSQMSETLYKRKTPER